MTRDIEGMRHDECDSRLWKMMDGRLYTREIESMTYEECDSGL